MVLEKLNPLSNIRGAQGRPTVFHSWTVAAAQITAPRRRQCQRILSTKLRLDCAQMNGHLHRTDAEADASEAVRCDSGLALACPINIGIR